jgi:hypothetical protein
MGTAKRDGSFVRACPDMSSTVKVADVNVDPEQIGSAKIALQLSSITCLTAETGLAVGAARRVVKEGLVETVPVVRHLAAHLGPPC